MLAHENRSMNVEKHITGEMGQFPNDRRRYVRMARRRDEDAGSRRSNQRSDELPAGGGAPWSPDYAEVGHNAKKFVRYRRRGKPRVGFDRWRSSHVRQGA